MSDDGRHTPTSTEDIKESNERNHQELEDDDEIWICDSLKVGHTRSILTDFYDTRMTEELKNALETAERDARGSSPHLENSIFLVRELTKPTCPEATDVANLAYAHCMKNKFIQAMILLRIAQDMHPTLPNGTEAATFLNKIIYIFNFVVIEQLRSDESTRLVVVQYGLRFMNEMYDALEKFVAVDDISGYSAIRAKRIYDVCLVLNELGMYEEVVSLGERAIKLSSQIQRVMTAVGLLLSDILIEMARALECLNRPSEATTHLELAQSLCSDAMNITSNTMAKMIVRKILERMAPQERKISQSAAKDFHQLS